MNSRNLAATAQQVAQKEYLTLQETAEALGKSAQTVRRMIKKGLLKAQRVRTPQGFNYVVYRRDFEANVGEPVLTAQNEMVMRDEMTMKDQMMLSHTASENHAGYVCDGADGYAGNEAAEYLANDYYILENESNEGIEKNRERELDKITLLGLIDTHHREKMMLFHILEELQAELSVARQEIEAQKRQSGTLLGWFRGLLGL